MKKPFVTLEQLQRFLDMLLVSTGFAFSLSLSCWCSCRSSRFRRSRSPRFWGGSDRINYLLISFH